jgi:Protein of unknown function (DUF2934)
MDMPEQVPGGEEKIQIRAYAIWEDEGRPEGRHLEHWRQAVQEIGAAAPVEPAAASPVPRRNGKGKA